MKKIDLKDVTFIIPIRLTDNDRVLNLITNLTYLNKYFNTNIIVKEYDSEAKADKIVLNFTDVLYIFERCEQDAPFHRTRLLNDMLAVSKTDITVNHDMDIILTTDTALKAKDMIKNEKFDVVYPYDKGTHECREISKTNLYYSEFIKNTELKILNKIAAEDQGVKPYGNAYMCGGCIWFNTAAYKAGGGENELFIDWGPEDRERLFRFEMLGYKIGWVSEGKIFHLEHKKAKNVDQKIWPDYIINNHTKYNLIVKMNKQQVEYFAKINSKKFN